jgi:hypothetical protein
VRAFWCVECAEHAISTAALLMTTRRRVLMVKPQLFVYGTRRFITVITRAFQWSLSYSSPSHSIALPSSKCRCHFNINCRHIYVYTYTLLVFLVVFPFYLSHQCSKRIALTQMFKMPCSSHVPWLDQSNCSRRRV